MTNTLDHIQSTARAWDMTEKRTRELYYWVRNNVEKDYRGTVFTRLLRRYQGTKTSEEAEKAE